MTKARIALACLTAASLLLAPLVTRADNPMGYRLFSTRDAVPTAAHRGPLGLRVERAQRISDDGMTFETIRVTGVQSGSPGARAGFSVGDQIVAVDGLVFSDLADFARYVASRPAGSEARFDIIPHGGGPAQAQRVAVRFGSPGAPGAPALGGLTTREKIGLGAAALAGCYMLGCFSHQASPAQQPQ